MSITLVEELVDLNMFVASGPSAGFYVGPLANLPNLATTAAKGNSRQAQSTSEPNAAEQVQIFEKRLQILQEQISSQKVALLATEDPKELKEKRRKVTALEEKLQATVQSLAAARLRLYSPAVETSSYM